MHELFSGEEWTLRAKCRRAQDPDSFYVSGAEQNQAKRQCRGCKVRLQCLAFAIRTETLDNTHGVWGGTTERERRRLVKRAEKRDMSRLELAQTILDLVEEPDQH
ncbi:MAG: WhiB family transcriptional regulator [Candidatus Saccharimonadales bacterium]